jgi:predicted ATP-dependent serine protease
MLIPCRECGAKISEMAKRCPQCGAPYGFWDDWDTYEEIDEARRGKELHESKPYDEMTPDEQASVAHYHEVVRRGERAQHELREMKTGCAKGIGGLALVVLIIGGLIAIGPVGWLILGIMAAMTVLDLLFAVLGGSIRRLFKS